MGLRLLRAAVLSPSSASFAAENLRYLTTEQGLADYVELLAHVKATTPGASNCRQTLHVE